MKETVTQSALPVGDLYHAPVLLPLEAQLVLTSYCDDIMSLTTPTLQRRVKIFWFSNARSRSLAKKLDPEADNYICD